MKLIKRVFELLLIAKFASCDIIQNPKSIYKTAKCINSTTIALLSNDNIWYQFPCPEQNQCIASEGFVKCVEKENVFKKNIKTHVVTITLPNNTSVQPTATVIDTAFSKYSKANENASFSISLDKTLNDFFPQERQQYARPEDKISKASTQNMANNIMDPLLSEQKFVDSPIGVGPSSANIKENSNNQPGRQASVDILNEKTLDRVDGGASMELDNRNTITEHKISGKNSNFNFSFPNSNADSKSLINSPSSINNLNVMPSTTPKISIDSGEFKNGLSEVQSKKITKRDPPLNMSSETMGSSSIAVSPANSSTGAAKKNEISNSGSGRGGSFKITVEQIKNTVTACGYSPKYKPEFVQELIKQINEQKWDNNEASMFLAQIYHESGGLNFLIEQACVSTPCTNYDNTNKSQGPIAGAPGKHYFGRGYIQLSWPKNYKEASNGIFKDDRLYTNPDQVATDKAIAAAVSIWFWNVKVMMVAKNVLKNFGESTKIINGEIECGKGPNKSVEKRYSNYLTIAKILGVTSPASNAGC